MSATKIGESTTNILKLFFFIIKLHFVTSNQLSTDRKLNLQCLFRLLSPRNAKKTQTDQNIPCVFPLCLKRNDPQTFKSASCKNPFLQCVCYCYNLLRSMLFILCDTWKTLLFMKLYRSPETVLSDMLLLSLKPVYCKKSVFYALSPQQQYDANTDVPK